jgi:PAS domain S-box-containing protein
MDQIRDEEIESLLEEIHFKEYELAQLRSRLGSDKKVQATYTSSNSAANLYHDTILLREILNSSVEAIFLVDTKKDQITYCNNRACELFGFDNRQELIGTRGSSLQRVPLAQKKLDAITALLRETGSWNDEIEYVSRTGRVFWGAISATFVSPPNQEPFYLVKILDIDERKRAEKKQRELLDNSQALICTHDMDGFILSANPAALKALGYTLETDLIGKSLSILFNENDMMGYRAYLDQIRATGQSEGTLKVRGATGKTYYWLYHNYRVDTGSEPPYVVGSAQDITQRVSMEKELKIAKAQAEKTMKARELFLANVSHELRTPLHGILGMSSVLKDSLLDEKQLQDLGGIKQSAENLLVIINDILDMAKMSSGKFELENAPFSPHEILESAIVPLLQKANNKGLSLYSEMPAKKLMILGDPYRLSQIALNLLNNAIKFTHEGSVYISVSDLSVSDPERALISVRVEDTGVGIPNDRLPYIFGEYEQAHKGYGGTGLGLAISKSLVEMQDGTLSCKSTEGKGSVFEVRISYPRVSNITAVQSKMPLSKDKLLGVRVLLVEDNPINQMICKHILEENGLVIDIEDKGAAALEKYAQHHHDVILMDIQLPDIGGEEITALIRILDEQGSIVPIIALTANAMKGDNERYMSAGMNGYLSKPYTEEALLEKIAEMVEMGKLR